jgi:hypothetical protein
VRTYWFDSLEVAAWRNRAGLTAGVVAGPFKSEGDADSIFGVGQGGGLGAFSPGDFDRIATYAGQFNASPYDTGQGCNEGLDVWPGYRSKIDSSWTAVPMQRACWHGKKGSAAALYGVLTNDTVLLSKFARMLIAQVRLGGSSDLRTWSTTSRTYPSKESGFKEATWIDGLAGGYACVRPMLKTALRIECDAWFAGASIYFVTRQNAVYSMFWPNRAVDDYTVRGWLARDGGDPNLTPKPQDPIYFGPQMTGTRNWAGDGYLYAFRRANGTLGPKISRVGIHYNNRSLAKDACILACGLVTGNYTLVESAKRDMREAIMFEHFSSGAPLELERGGDYGNPSRGLYYHAISIETLMRGADLLARQGDFSLYRFSSDVGVHGTQGRKDLWTLIQWYAQRYDGSGEQVYYGPVAEANRIKANLSTPDAYNLQYLAFDYTLAIVNKYYRSPWLRSVYLHQVVGMTGISKLRNCSAAEVWLPWAGTGSQLVGGYGLYVGLEDLSVYPSSLGTASIVNLMATNSTGSDLGLLPRYSTLNLQTVGLGGVAFRPVLTGGATPGSVEYTITPLSGGTSQRVVINTAPFSWPVGSGWLPSAGGYRITVQPWAGASRSGVAGLPYTVQVNIRAGVR